MYIYRPQKYNKIRILKDMSHIFETKRLMVRKLILSDLNRIHKMQSNINVMKYVRPSAMTYEENKHELQKLIKLYDLPKNDFWIYATELKQTKEFIGTVALVKHNSEDEIGYRFIEDFWGNGFGYEVVEGLLKYCKSIGKEKVVAFAAKENLASTKILEKLNFMYVKDTFAQDLKLEERKFEYKL
jgi:RimJ/RimL family protein N-acetyltransferase